MVREKIVFNIIDGKLKKYRGILSVFDDFISIDDRRLHQRVTADVLDMHGKAAYATVARILNMSTSGMLLETEGRLDLGDTCILKMEGKGRVVNVKSVVVWSLSDRRIKTLRGNFVSMYKTGLKFINISQEKMGEIIGFIENHKQKVDEQRDIFAASGLRLHMRFQIETPEKAILICRKDYKIINLSLDGMLIESKNSLDIGKKLSMEISRSKDKLIKVLGRVVSCILIEESDYAHCDIGIEFFGIVEKDREMLKEAICFLENMGFIAI
jgi:hypothetical protein